MNKFKKVKIQLWTAWAFNYLSLLITGFVYKLDASAYVAASFVILVLICMVDLFKPEKTIDEQFRTLK